MKIAYSQIVSSPPADRLTERLPRGAATAGQAGGALPRPVRRVEAVDTVAPAGRFAGQATARPSQRKPEAPREPETLPVVEILMPDRPGASGRPGIRTISDPSVRPPSLFPAPPGSHAAAYAAAAELRTRGLERGSFFSAIA